MATIIRQAITQIIMSKLWREVYDKHIEDLETAEQDVKDFQESYDNATKEYLDTLAWKNKMKFNLNEAKKRLSILKEKE